MTMLDGLNLPDALGLELRGDVAILTLQRPEKRNALDTVIVAGLERFFNHAPDSIRAVVLAGSGGHFSAGLDLNDVKETDVRDGVMHSRLWHRAFEAIEFGRMPVVCVMHGAVVGGGLELACACHVRVADESTFYALPEGQRGIFVGGGGSVRIPRLIGVSRMMDMMLTGRTYGAQEGLALGLSHYLVARGSGLARGIEIAQKIAGNAPLTNFALMHALPRIAEANPATGYMMEALMSGVTQGDGEAKLRLRDFLEKRAAKVSHT